MGSVLSGKVGIELFEELVTAIFESTLSLGENVNAAFQSAQGVHLQSNQRM